MGREVFGKGEKRRRLREVWGIFEREKDEKGRKRESGLRGVFQ